MLSINRNTKNTKKSQLVSYRLYCDMYLDGQTKLIHTVGQNSVL